MKRAGVTLVELMIGLTLLALVGRIATSGLRFASRSLATAAQGLVRERTLSTVTAFLYHELRDADSAGLNLVAPARLLLARRIGEGIPCLASGTTAVIRSSDWMGSRLPEATRDVARILTNVSSATWVEIPISDVASADCPDGSPGMELSFTTSVASAHWIRIAEPVAISTYRSGGSNWAGLAPADGSSPVQPLAGPLATADSTFHFDSGNLLITLRPISGNRDEVRIPLNRFP